MIRLVIVVVMLYLIWLLFIAGFTRKKKIVIACITLFAGGILMWFEGADVRLKDGLVKVNQVHNCGVQSVHTYRTNFDVSICLENKASVGKIQRITIEVLAEQCQNDTQCAPLETVQRDVLFVLGPSSTQTLEQNLDFKLVDPALPGLRWSAEVLRAQATKK